MKKGDIVKFKHISKNIILQLTEKPIKVKLLNGVSDEDEILLNGYILSQSKRKEFYRDSRYKDKKPFIVKKDDIILIKEYTKLRLFFDNNITEHSEYNTIEEVKEFVNKVKFQWNEFWICDPFGKIVYEEKK